MKHKFLLLVLVFAAMLAAPAAAFAASPPDEVVAGGVFALKQGEVLDGNLIVLGGSARIEAGARITGDVVVLGGEVTIDGEVGGAVSVFRGTLDLKENARISGDLNVLGGETDVHRDAQIQGAIQPALPPTVAGSEPGRGGGIHRLLRGFWDLFWVFSLAGLAVAGAILWPDRLRQTAAFQTGNPALATGIGLLAGLVLLPAALFLAATILLFPVALLLVLAAGAAILAGWASIALAVGETAARALKQTWSPGLQAGLGSFGLSALYFSLGYLPCLGWLMRLALLLLCLGGTALTRFGSRAYLAEP